VQFIDQDVQSVSTTCSSNADSAGRNDSKAWTGLDTTFIATKNGVLVSLDAKQLNSTHAIFQRTQCTQGHLILCALYRQIPVQFILKLGIADPNHLPVVENSFLSRPKNPSQANCSGVQLYRPGSQ
jgi:hypothetical protein